MAQVAVINRYSQRKYDQMIGSIGLAGECVQKLTEIIDTMDNNEPVSDVFTVATPDELRGMQQKAIRSLDQLHTAAKKWEAELRSREWRV